MTGSDRALYGDVPAEAAPCGLSRGLSCKKLTLFVRTFDRSLSMRSAMAFSGKVEFGFPSENAPFG